MGEKFRNRALRFPALISGCSIDWFQPWPKDALILVARHFLTEFIIECTDEVKEELVNALGCIQDTVANTSTEYFQRYVCLQHQKSSNTHIIPLSCRFRRATHVTPKSYLNFIAGYKSIYKSKQIELNEGALRMDTGLEKLAEASASVEVLKKELAVMEQELAEASERAEKVLTEVYKFNVQIIEQAISSPNNLGYRKSNASRSGKKSSAKGKRKSRTFGFVDCKREGVGRREVGSC